MQKLKYIMNTAPKSSPIAEPARPRTRSFLSLLHLAIFAAILGCATDDPGRQRDEFFTSGSREADQRAGQIMAREAQFAEPGRESEPERDENGKRTLYERLGGEDALIAIVDDFTERVLQDPRVNWSRHGVQRGRWIFRRNRDNAAMWEPSPENVARLKTHLVQFLALATGGPAQYDGRDLQSVHARMRISNAEFDAAVGDLKASLDKLRIPDREQKELLAIIESTRPLIVTLR